MPLSTHRTKKALGQHFLTDPAVVGRILAAIDPQPGDRLVEIGPGAGALTFPLLERHRRLTVIEFDRDLIQPLREAARGRGELELVHADVLAVDLAALAGEGPIRLVGNLPYNISSPILFHALGHLRVIRDMHFMLQKEVVQRMGAAPGSKEYGRLSVMLQVHCHVEPLFVVPPSAFRPPPRVDSAVVRLVPRPVHEVAVRNPAVLERVVKAAFAQRRKTLRNALAGTAPPELLERLGIDPGWRAERVAVRDFVRLANALTESPPAASVQ